MEEKYGDTYVYCEKTVIEGIGHIRIKALLALNRIVRTLSRRKKNIAIWYKDMKEKCFP